MPPLYPGHSYHRLITYSRETGSVYIRANIETSRRFVVEGWEMGTVIVNY